VQVLRYYLAPVDKEEFTERLNIGDGEILGMDGQDMLEAEFDDTSDGIWESESEEEDYFDENNSMERGELENELDELIDHLDG
jgi:hypothetical protein